MEIKIKVGEDEAFRNAIKTLAHQVWAGMAREEVHKTYEEEARRVMRSLNAVPIMEKAVDAILGELVEADTGDQSSTPSRMSAAEYRAKYATRGQFLRKMMERQAAQVIQAMGERAIRTILEPMVYNTVTVAVRQELSRLQNDELKQRAKEEVQAALKRIATTGG